MGFLCCHVKRQFQAYILHWDWKDAFLDKEELEGMPGISFLYMRNPGLKKDLC